MITTVAKMREMPCVMKLDRWGGSCGAFGCPAWHFWIDPRETMGGKNIHKTPGHGKKDSEKMGYCGMTGGY
jgi:hypothetical protein